MYNFTPGSLKVTLSHLAIPGDLVGALQRLQLQLAEYLRQVIRKWPGDGQAFQDPNQFQKVFELGAVVFLHLTAFVGFVQWFAAETDLFYGLLERKASKGG